MLSRRADREYKDRLAQADGVVNRTVAGKAARLRTQGLENSWQERVPHVFVRKLKFEIATSTSSLMIFSPFRC